MESLFRLQCALIALLLLAGCGQSGPLFIPGDPSSIQAPPEPTAEDAADEAEDREEEQRQ